MPVYMGSQRIKELYIGGQRIKSAHMWNGTAWQRVHIWPVTAPSRVNKSGDQLLGSGYFTLTGWGLAAGYQGQSDTNGLRIVGSGTVDITAQVTTQSAGGGNNRWLRIHRNGVQVGDEANSSTTGPIVATATGVTVADGDVISLYCRCAGTLDQYRNVLAGSGTYIQITAA